MSTKRKMHIVEPIEALLDRPGVRYVVSKDRARNLVERVKMAPPGSVVRFTQEEMRIWRDHVVVING